MDRVFDVRLPADKPYAVAHPVSALAAGSIPQVPVAIAINWYSNFDAPVQVKAGSALRWFVGQSDLGSIRGGHCVAGKSPNHSDLLSWWTFYNQLSEGACVGFGTSRVMSLMNRKRYDARWLWDMAKKADQYADTNPGDNNGTSLDAAMKVLASRGHVLWQTSYADRTWQQRDTEAPVASEGVSSYKWALTVDDVRAVLQAPLNDALQAIPFINSWGRDYPHVTWMPYSVLERLLSEDGEVALVVDRV